VSHNSPAVQQALDALDAHSQLRIDLRLARLRALLRALGDPQERLPPVIHVAGTNGKGSTCAVLRAIGAAAGLRVHVDTSPHLVRFNERIRLAGELISDDALVAVLERVRRTLMVTGLPITRYEAYTAAAFLAFAEAPADLLVLEVGLGGRFDATNTVADPVVSVIAPVDYDHTEFLSRELTRIAWEKAGIIRAGVPVVSAAQHRAALGVIALEAAQKGAALYRLGVSAQVESDGTAMRFRGARLATGWVRPSLPGAHQFANAGLACLAMEVWGDGRITGAALEAGIASAVWPARMQRLRPGPLQRLVPQAELWLDGGHNPHAARALAEHLAALARTDPRPLTLIMAMLANKDHGGVFAALAGTGARVIAIPNVEGHKGAEPEALALSARAAGLEAGTAADLETALRMAGEDAPQGRILICGSLYLAGEVLARNGQFPE
jgi:dihydrofolate synthase/folylpolyglutamate synthase